MSDFYCETPDSGEPPCAGVAKLRERLAEAEKEIERLEAGYKSRGLTDPHCESCQTQDERNEALPAALVTLAREIANLQLELSHAAGTSLTLQARLAEAERDAARWRQHAIHAAKLLWDWRNGYLPSTDSEELVAKIRADQSFDAVKGAAMEGGE